MSAVMRWLTRAYVLLLRLYPHDFHDEFGEEMRIVFADALADASVRSRLLVVAVCLRELCDLPAAIFCEHWRERRKRNLDAPTDYPMPEKPIPRHTMLAALLVFIIPGLYQVLNDSWISFIPFRFVLFPVFLTILIILFIAGLIQGFPRWALPLVGLVSLPLLSFFSALLTAGPWWSILLPPPIVGDEDARLLWQVINSGFVWLNFLLTAILIALIIRSWKPLRRLFWRIRRDWTQLSFFLYGATLFSVVPAFDEYRYNVPFQIGSMLFLAAGAWAYLRASNPRHRLLALLVGATLAMSVIAIGKWLIVPLQNWTMWSSWHPPEVERRFESVRTLCELGWILIALAAPALLTLLPRKRESVSGT